MQEQRVFESKAKWEEQSRSKAKWMAQYRERQRAAAQQEADLLNRRRELSDKLAADKARKMEQLILEQVDTPIMILPAMRCSQCHHLKAVTWHLRVLAHKKTIQRSLLQHCVLHVHFP